MSPRERFREVAQRGKHTDPGWYRVHRRVSIHLTRLALAAGVRADDASIAMILIGIAGAALLVPVSAASNALGFLLFYLAFLLDKVDGELARVRGTENARGILVDRFYHRLVEPLLFLAVAAHEFRQTGATMTLVAGFVTAMVGNAIEENQHLVPYILMKRLREGGRLPSGPAPRRSPALGAAAALLRPLKGFRMLIVMLPVFAMCYLAELMTGGAFPSLMLYVSAAGLVLYLVFQCFYYVHERLDVEAHAIASMLRRHGTTTERNGFEPRIVSAIATPRRRRVRPPRTAVATPASPEGDAR